MKSILGFIVFVVALVAITTIGSIAMFDAALKHMELVTTYQQPAGRTEAR